VGVFWNPAELHWLLTEFSMIHHLARAFFVRSSNAARPAANRAALARTEPSCAPERLLNPVCSVAPRRLRISSDPLDARRTVIAGRFADVCAALDRLVLEQEATA
jgi:hypothetical protein